MLPTEHFMCTVVLMSEPVLTITLGGGAPAYKQVLDQLRLLIQTDELSSGQTLPGVRSLAAQLGVHHNTIAEAYRVLAGEGLLDVSHGRRATVVDAPTPVVLTQEESSDLRRRLRSLVAELRSKGIPAKTILNDTTAVLGS